MNVFTLEHVSMEYQNGATSVQVLHDIDFVVKEAETVAFVGPSGAGKSTLLNIMSGLEVATSGSITYMDKCFNNLKKRMVDNLRLKEFGMVYQNFYLIPTMTVRDNIWLPAMMAYNKVNGEFYEQLVEELGLTEIVDKMPNYLSGGEMQRVAIARALINQPKVLFADEPTGNLDSKNGDNVFQLLFECAKKYNQTLLYVTHDMDKAKMAGRVITIKDGVISESD